MERDNKWKNVLTICFSVLLLAGLIYFLIGGVGTKPSGEDEEVSQSDLGTIEFEGKTYRYNHELFNVLFMGIDNDEKIRDQDIPGDAGQADCIMIVSFNKETKEAKLLQIPRETMTEIDLYDGNGNRYDTVNRAIALQYAYGSGGENSCWAVKKTVSELLYDLQIDGYVALDIASVPIINDVVGGVTITLAEDYTEIDPAFEKGATVTLNGEQAHSFVRYRDIEEDFSNQERMQRQMQYLPALVSKLKGQNYESMLPLVEEYMLTDLREDQIDSFTEIHLEGAEIEFLPGEWVSGETYDEYHMDDGEVQKLLLEMFYISESEWQ